VGRITSQVSPDGVRSIEQIPFVICSRGHSSSLQSARQATEGHSGPGFQLKVTLATCNMGAKDSADYMKLMCPATSK
jgi:hypothetical protein